jgi:hypothetical protein
MKTFLVRPDFARGGDDWQMVVRAACPRQAISLAYAEITDDDQPNFKQVEDQPNDGWTVWQFPDTLSAAPAVIAWDQVYCTFWEAL